MTSYILLSSGTPSAGQLNINLVSDNEEAAKFEAGKVAKRLHLAGWYRHDLFAQETAQAVRVISFRTETEEPSIILGKLDQ